MCERRKNEPYKSFFLRWLLENPQWILAAVEGVAVGVLFWYFMGYLDKQIEAQMETVKQLSELTTRIEHIERKLDH